MATPGTQIEQAARLGLTSSACAMPPSPTVAASMYASIVLVAASVAACSALTYQYYHQCIQKAQDYTLNPDNAKLAGFMPQSSL